MHEFSLMKDLMRKVEAVAREQQADRVVALKVRLGALCHISANHFREHFTAAAVGTAAEGARLEIEENNDPNDPQALEILLESMELESS